MGHHPLIRTLPTESSPQANRGAARIRTYRARLCYSQRCGVHQAQPRLAPRLSMISTDIATSVAFVDRTVGCDDDRTRSEVIGVAPATATGATPKRAEWQRRARQVPVGTFGVAQEMATGAGPRRLEGQLRARQVPVRSLGGAAERATACGRDGRSGSDTTIRA